MKFFIYIILLVAISESFCLVSSKIKKTKQTKLDEPKDLADFPQAILDEINQYLDLYQKPKLVMNDLLKETSKLAADEIIAHNSFGQHSNIEDWQNKMPNDIFTEICFNVNITNSNYYSKSLSSKTSKIMYDTKMSVGTIMKTPVAPTPQMLAKNIIEALESEHLLLTLDQYTNCGISIAPMDQTKFPNEYLAVLHLIKPKEQQIFASCKEAKDKGITSDTINISVNGETKSVTCMNEYGGGWTLIHTENKDYGKGVILQINDLGLNYEEIFIKAGEKNLIDYDMNNAGIWDLKGFAFDASAFQFGTTWYVSDDWPNYTYKNQYSYELMQQSIQNLAKYPSADLKPENESTPCKYYNEDFPKYCSTAFSLKKQQGERLTAISDLEMIANKNANNHIYYDFQLYVR